ncbi:unnamed protein product [Prorocentrum cordatum]|uniref:Uncharacterized protein n=1 Tax=Prorocentrum cordatum TaxID=2364126 RepID=A0ABN9VH86_9DINO|nr:unnamed protein product [Polarella glacialis]
MGRRGGGTKVLLETIQVARHLGQMCLRPLGKTAVQAARAGEELALGLLRMQPLEEVLGRSRTRQLQDAYFQAREVASGAVASLSHQSIMSAQQSAAQLATSGLQKAGIEARVVGPLDEHGNTRKVLRDLKTGTREHAERGGKGAIRLIFANASPRSVPI